MTDLNANQSKPLHIVTPLITSVTLSKLCGRTVLLKLDNLQPSGSFKIRGIGHLVQKAVSKGYTHIVCPSGGNAGMAAAYAARQTCIASTVVIPTTSPKMMVTLIENEGAQLMIHGDHWDDAHAKAIELAMDNSWCYIQPFDHADVWEGNSSLVTEVMHQCNEKPSAIVVSVGGGGLLSGILHGLKRHDAEDVTVVAMETQGAHSYSAARRAGKPVSIGEITSIAKTLGALCVTRGVFDLQGKIDVISKVISDTEAVMACLKFADEHRLMVEPACGAALAAAYSGILSQLITEGKISGNGPVVIVVCGGNAVSHELMNQWKDIYG